MDSSSATVNALPGTLACEETVMVTNIKRRSGIVWNKSFMILSFLDPDTGIGKKKSKRHITISDFVDFLDSYPIVFSYDQSFSYSKNHKAEMMVKLKELHNHGGIGFYYDSHAKFLFGSKSANVIESLKECFSELGLPSFRIVEIDL